MSEIPDFMRGMALPQQPSKPPTVIQFPMIGYGFDASRDIQTGETISVSLLLNLPGTNFHFSIPFDRITFARFLADAHRALGESENGSE